MSYTSQVLWQAVDALGTADQPLNKRWLQHAAGHLLKLKPEDFPQDLRPTFNAIMYDLSADPRHHDDVGSSASTISTMTDQTAARVATSIRDLHAELERRGLGTVTDG